MTVESNIEKDVVAHPMPGWLAVIPITDPNENKNQEEDETPSLLTLIGVIPPNGPLVLAGIVVESNDHSPHSFTPNETKVFFWADRGVTIGERTFILESSVICYA